MTLRVRRILSIIFILLFLTITPAIMLYAAGYRLGRNIFLIQRTGMFIIDSKPAGAKILLNGKAQKTFLSGLLNRDNYITTPAKIKDLLPGDYDVKVELPGYWSWQKKLTISPGASTFAENIYLFKNDLPIQVLPGDYKAISLDPADSMGLVPSNGRLTFLNLNDETEKTFSQPGLSGKNPAFSPGQAVAGNYLFNLGGGVKIDLSKSAAGCYGYKWNRDAFYCRDKNSLYRITPSGGAEKILGPAVFADFLVKNEKIYLIGKTKTASVIAVYDLVSGARSKDITLPYLGDFSFTNPGHNLLNLYDKSEETLYLVDPAPAYSPVTETITGAKTAFWPNVNNLVYTNDFEIWLYDLASREKTLVTRISEPVGGAVMHPSKNYLIFYTSKSINVIELDNREKRNITELVKFDAIGSLAINSSGEILYFSGRIGNMQGLYKLSIQ